MNNHSTIANNTLIALASLVFLVLAIVLALFLNGQFEVVLILFVLSFILSIVSYRKSKKIKGIARSVSFAVLFFNSFIFALFVLVIVFFPVLFLGMDG